MGRVDLSFIGRLDTAEAAGVLALLGRACAGSRIVRASVTAPATDAARAAAAHLMDLRGVRLGPDGETRFPLAVRATERAERGTIAVELHPLMREKDALAVFVAHLVGGVPGRLVRRLWGRWGQTVTDPTEELMEAVGAGRMRFAQFGEEVLKGGLSRARAVADVAVGVTTEREGRGSKVVRVVLAVGDAPAWLAGADDADGADPETAAGHAARLPAVERGEFYKLAVLAMRGGRRPAEAFRGLRDWLAASDDPADLRLAAAAGECALRGSVQPVATALEAVLAACAPDAATGLWMLARDGVAWPDSEAGAARCKAWAMRAAGSLASAGVPTAPAIRRLRAAVDVDERASVLVPADAALLRGALDCLHTAFSDPLQAAGGARPPLTARESFRIAAAADTDNAAEALFAMADAAESAAA